MHWAQASGATALWYWPKHPLLFQVFSCKWLITLQKRVRRTLSTDGSICVWARWILREFAAWVRGKSRDWSKKSLEIVLIVAPRDKRDARQRDVTLKSRQPFSCNVRKHKAQKITVRWGCSKSRKKPQEIFFCEDKSARIGRSTKIWMKGGSGWHPNYFLGWIYYIWNGKFCSWNSFKLVTEVLNVQGTVLKLQVCHSLQIVIPSNGPTNLLFTEHREENWE